MFPDTRADHLNMAFSDVEQIAHEDAMQSAIGNETIRSSGSKTYGSDELAVSQRGSLPAKGSHTITTTIATKCSMSIEDQLNLLSAEEEKSWKYQDSVHRNSQRPPFATQYFDHNNNSASDSSNNFDDSCASFDTFGGGPDDVGENSESELLKDEKAAFCNLEPEMTPRRKILSARAPSSRLIRSLSTRASNLHLIEEDDL